MSLQRLFGQRGTTIAGLLVLGLVLVFVVPYASYLMALAFSAVVSYSAESCSLAGTCTYEVRSFTTPFGSVEVRIPRPSDDVLSAFVYYAAPVFVALLTLVSRPELLAVAFAVDLISFALETTE